MSYRGSVGVGGGYHGGNSVGGGRGGRGGRGRGEYYKQKYGGGRKGNNNNSNINNISSSSSSNGRGDATRVRGDKNDGRDTSVGKDRGGSYDNDFIPLLKSLDGKSYPAYHDIESSRIGWSWSSKFNKFKSKSTEMNNSCCDFTLLIGRAQSDPFAPPTRCRLIVPSDVAKFPPSLYSDKNRSMALGDYIHRAFYAACLKMGAHQTITNINTNNNNNTNGSYPNSGGGWSGPKGGDITISKPSQHIIQQSAVNINNNGDIIAQFTINLPARGRTILGLRAVDIFQNSLPALVQQSLLYTSLHAQKLQHHILSIADQQWLRNYALPHKDLVAFIPNGAILPRVSGVDDRPMNYHRPTNHATTLESAESAAAAVAVPFRSPPQFEITFHLPNTQTAITGMGVPKGITLLVGGGFHGKSTLLQALQVGIYDKLPGDGREFCVCHPTAAKIRAEDGRAVTSVNITPFIDNLPFGKSTLDFSTMDASGSTSQAANIIEALEVGSKLLLIDEDTCATNFMIRDEKMMRLVAPDKEPITPFIRKVRSLYKEMNVSCILVIGGSGDYFDVADHVLVMDSYTCHDVTQKAKQIVNEMSSSLPPSAESASIPFGDITPRYIHGSALKPSNHKVKTLSQSKIAYGGIDIDIAGLEQVISTYQTNFISSAMQIISSFSEDGKDMTLQQVVNKLESILDADGLDAMTPGQFHGGLARARALDVAGAINRFRRDNALRQRPL